MAYFTETDKTITLKHHNTVYTFKKTTEEEIQNGLGATFSWSNESVVLNENFKLSRSK